MYYHLHLQPSEIEKFPFYEYEITIENLQDFLKEKHDAEKGQQDAQQSNMPNMSKFNAPKMPNIKMPKL